MDGLPEPPSQAHLKRGGDIQGGVFLRLAAWVNSHQSRDAVSGGTSPC